jgi:hypothetical protein
LKFSQKLSACLPYRDYHRGCSRRRTTLVPAGIIDQAASDAQSSNGAALIGFDMEDAQPARPSQYLSRQLTKSRYLIPARQLPLALP